VSVSAEKSSGHALDAGQFEVTVMRGVVKWYDQKRGYGFIRMPDGHPDAILLPSRLKEAGYAFVRKDSHITCQVVSGPRGMQCVRVLSIDESTTLLERERSTDIKNVRVVEGPTQLAVKSFFSDRGYGFFELPGRPDVFFHNTTLKWSGVVRSPVAGQVFDVFYGENTAKLDGSLLAVAVRSTTS